MVAKGGEGRGGIKKEFGINRYIPIVCEINNKDLLYSTGNYIQYLAIRYYKERI